MREIKFKAWDKKRKGMIKDVSVSSEYVEYEQECYTSHEDMIPMQYTGLKDKNGKEIYEGDIVKIYDEDFGYSVWEVIWYSGTININSGEYAGIYTGFCVKCVVPSRWGSVGDIEGMAIAEETEVVGNIYENPVGVYLIPRYLKELNQELLEGNKDGNN